MQDYLEDLLEDSIFNALLQGEEQLNDQDYDDTLDEWGSF